MTTGPDVAAGTWRSKNPFPGLRPFLAGETHLFFGRDEPTDELIGQLGGSRFLAVVGVSGSGKSSLVKCGVLPALYGGYLAEAGSSWRVAIFRPGDDPIRNLATALAANDVLPPPGGDAGMGATILETVLRRGSLGLHDAARQARLGPKENLLVVADQFEELFRFKQNMQATRPDDEAAGFVKLLVEATRTDLPVYVMITMRSDFLGDCAQFRDLPEAINEGLYLIPRMTRDQLREAIEGPVRMAGAHIAPRLVQRLLNDVGDNPDQLPILQHALMRTWDHWASDERDPEPLDLSDYDGIGGMEGALDRHLDEVLETVAKVHPARPERREIAKRMFQTLTEKEEDNRAIRRPATVDEIRAVADAGFADVSTIIEEFRARGRTFLMPPFEVDLTGDTLIDISHESLIRNWTELREWVEEEGRSARIYKRLSDTAALHGAGRAALYRGPDLEIALEWRNETRPTEAWARRYDDRFSRSMGFLRQSEANARYRKWGLRAAVTAAFAVTVGFTAYQRQQTAKAERWQTLELAQDMIDVDPVQTALVVTELGAHGDPRPPRGFEIAMGTAMTHLPYAIADGHDGAVPRIAFDPTRNRALTVGVDGVARVWDTRTGGLVGSVNDSVAGGRVWNAAFIDAPGGAALVTFSDPGLIQTWREGRPVTIRTSGEPFHAVRFSDDGRFLAVAYDAGSVTVRDTQTGASLSLDHPGALDIVFSPDGSRAVTWTSSELRVWERSGEQVGSFSLDRVDAVTFAQGGSILLVTGFVRLPDRVGDATIVFGGGGTAPIGRFEHPGQGTAIAALGSEVLVGLESGGILHYQLGQWRATTRPGAFMPTAGPRRQFLAAHEGPVRSLSFSPDGSRVISASAADATVRVWDPVTGEELHTLRGHTGNVTAGFSPDGTRIITAGAEGGVRFWWPDGTRWYSTLKHPDEVHGIAFDPTGARVVTGSLDGTVRIWDVSTGSEVGEPRRHSGAVRAVAFSPDGRRIAAAAGDSAYMWPAEGDGSPISVGHEAVVVGVAFSLDGAALLTASDDRTARLWDTGTGAPLGEPRRHEWGVLGAEFDPGVRGAIATGDDDMWLRLWLPDGTLDAGLEHDDSVRDLAFSPTGKFLVAASGDSAVVWVRTRGEAAQAPWLHWLPLRVGAPVRSVAVPSDTVVVTGDGRGGIRLWGAETGVELRLLGRHADEVTAVTLSPDGEWLASASRDGTARLWPLTWEGLVPRLRAAVQGCLPALVRMRLLGESSATAATREVSCRTEAFGAGSVGRSPE